MIARTPLMIGRCLSGRAADRIAEQERHTEVLESRADAGPLVLVVRAAGWRCAAEKDSQLNSSAICCLRACCGDVATSTVKMPFEMCSGARTRG
jgi:hypothetical protein